MKDKEKTENTLLATISHPFTFEWNEERKGKDKDLLATITYPFTFEWDKKFIK